jgi:uncharacterized protein (DUF58 family)
VRRRVSGLLAGEFRSIDLGAGTELAQIRPYRPGDDVRLIDWSATARTGEPHVRVNVAERPLTTLLVLDTSASMQFGTADRRKADVAEGVALALGHVASRRGNRLGLATFGGPDPVSRPPRQGRAGLLAALLALRDQPDAGEDGQTDLGPTLERLARVQRGRALVVIVSDMRGPLDWRPALTQLAARHDVLVIEPRDPREDELVDVGDLALVDPETGRRVRVDTASARLRERYAEAALAERDAVADEIFRAGADHVVLSTRGDWLRRLLMTIERRRRTR